MGPGFSGLDLWLFQLVEISPSWLLLELAPDEEVAKGANLSSFCSLADEHQTFLASFSSPFFTPFPKSLY
jgi:hypothetical protein